MNKILLKILEKISLKTSLEQKSQYYLDLQGVIERYTQNLYLKDYDDEYLYLFSEKEFLDIRLTSFELFVINKFLFYNGLFQKNEEEIYFNAKCIKAISLHENITPICNLIRLYYHLDNDNINSTLLRAIMDTFDDTSYLNNIDFRDILTLLSKSNLKETKYLINFITELENID